MHQLSVQLQRSSFVAATWLVFTVGTLVVYRHQRKSPYQFRVLCGGAFLCTVVALVLPITGYWFRDLEIWFPFVVFFATCLSAAQHHFYRSTEESEEGNMTNMSQEGSSKI